jgi:hypothetical protein
MKKAEKFTIPSAGVQAAGATFIAAVHGQNGLVHSGFTEPLNGAPAFNDIITSALAAVPGLRRVRDFCAGNPGGTGPNMYSIHPGPPGSSGQNVRSTSATSYIYPFMNSKHNLTILTKHQAIKMTWGANVGGKANANGVQFVPTPAINATLPPAFQVTAAKEVLVAAGAFGVSTYSTLCLFRGLTILSVSSLPRTERRWRPRYPLRR